MSKCAQVRSEQLKKALESALSEHFRKSIRIIGLQRRRSRYSSSFSIENLELKLAGGKSLKLVFKNSSPASILQSARDVRPAFLYHPLREIEIYRKVLDPVRLGTPIFYGAVARPELDRYWLFLERVPGPLLWQVGHIETWRQAARWLAELNNHFARTERNRVDNRLVPLLQYDRNLLNLWWRRAEVFLSGTAQRGAVEQRSLRSFVRLTERHDQVIDRLLALANTFIHGEFYPSNVILRRQRTGRRICAIDWEVAGMGPGLVDVAALTSGAWDAAQKRTMIAAYRDALAPARGWPPSLQELVETVKYCQLHLAIQWLGWAADWSPPKMHAHDWLREAVRLSTALGI